jgi:flagellar assembly factor FliW
MPSTETKYFGTMAYREESVFEFPWGLPAFEHEKHFVPIESPKHAPLVFLQSLADPGLCFLAFPILVVDRDYQLGISPEDLAGLGLNMDRQPELGADVLVLALLSLHDGFSATANLMAPIVINLSTRRALQAIRCDSLYSFEHSLAPRSAQDPAASARVSENDAVGCGCARSQQSAEDPASSAAVPEEAAAGECCGACSQPGTKPQCSREEAC